MKYARILFTLVFFAIILQKHLWAQAINKRAGLCFRIDDPQPPEKLLAFDSIFNKNNKHFTYAPNSVRATRESPSNFWPTVKILQDHGHEIGDHSPNHYSQFFELLDEADTLKMTGKPGVNHIGRSTITSINGPRICLNYNILNSGGSGDEGNLNLRGSQVISSNNGEFANGRIYGNVYYVSFYLPQLNIILNYTNLYNLNPNDPDTADILSFWNEPIDLGSLDNVPFKKLSNYDVDIDPDGFKLMQQFSLSIFNKNNIAPPTVWIQPGGNFPYLDKSYVAPLFKKDFPNFKSAATYRGTIKGFNEYDPKQDDSYGMEWGDITEENQTIQQMKDVIADRQARHMLTFGLNHFNAFGGSFTFEELTAHVDNLLIWCGQNNIPVYTYSEWGKILYASLPHVAEDMMPALNVDLNADGYPDGYTNITTTYDATQGVSQSGGRSLTLNTSSGMLFNLARLCGIEKGENIFKVWTKGTGTDKVNFLIDFPELSKQVQFDVPCSTGVYTQYTYHFYVPEGLSLINIQCNGTINAGGDISVSGMELRGASKPKIHFHRMMKQANETWPQLALDDYVNDDNFIKDSLHWTVISQGSFVQQLDNVSRFLHIGQSNPFWTGSDSLLICVGNPSGQFDTAWLYIQSRAAKVCKGEPFSINYIPDTTDLTFLWTASPPDPTLQDVLPDPTVRPLQNTTYSLHVTRNGAPDLDLSIPVEVAQTKDILFDDANIDIHPVTSLIYPVNEPFGYRMYLYNHPVNPTALVGDSLLIAKNTAYAGYDTAQLYICNTVCDAGIMNVITDSRNVGVKETDLTKNFKTLEVWPNPFSNEINLRNTYSQKSARINIYNLQGQLLQSIEIETEQAKITTSSLSEGVYLLQALYPDGYKTNFKLIRN